jgi:flagellar basal body-associated protein FliL
MENNKIIKVIAITIILLTVAVIATGYFYFTKAAHMMGDAIHQSEIQASKYDETNSPEACEKLRKELGVKYLEHPNVKNGTCPK